MKKAEDKSQKRIWLSAGGTGGHIAPCAAMVESIPGGYEYICFTLEKNQEYHDIKVMSEKNVKIYPAKKIPSSLHTLLSFIAGTIRSIKILKKEFRRQKPDAVLAFGGYPVFPILLFFLFRKIPIFLFEQNSVHGLVTRIFRKKASAVFLSYPRETYKKNEILIGNPLRENIRNKISARKTSWPPKKILITGGSQGAKDLNDLFVLMSKDPFFKKFQITIATGPNHYENLKHYQKPGIQIHSFIENMHEHLNQCDLILCRSGSGSVFEAAMSRKPAVFFPYPYATDNHQMQNALPLKKAGLAEIIDERPFRPELAIEKLKHSLDKDSFLSKAADKYQRDNPLPLDGHQTAWEHIESLINHSDSSIKGIKEEV